VHLADQAFRWSPVKQASALKAFSAGEKPHTGCSSGPAPLAGAPGSEEPGVGCLESLKSRRREAGLIAADQRGAAKIGQRDRPSSRAESRRKRNRRRPTSVCGQGSRRSIHGSPDEPATLHLWSVRETRKRQSPRQHRPPPHRPAAGDGWHGRVKAQQADTCPAQSAAWSRGSRESGSVWRPISRRKTIGVFGLASTTGGPLPRRTRAELSGRRKAAKGQIP
jgi:hypothetical protein